MYQQLRITGRFWLLFAAFLFARGAWAQVTPVPLTAINAPYTQDFNSLTATGTSTTVPMGFTFVEGGTGANTTYIAGTGSSTAGDTYSFGTTAADRAFGGLRSGAVITTIGASFVNNTTTTITSLNITYTGEEWRFGTTGRADRLDFQYSTNATSLTVGTYIDADALDFSTPNSTTAAGVGLRDGNAAANRTTITGTIAGLSIAPGATFWIRYTDFDAAGADDGLAIDDFSLTPIGAVTPTTATVTLSASGAGITENPAQSVTITATASATSTTDQTVGLTPTGSAANGADYSLSAPTITILSGQLSGSITLTSLDDLISEGPETAILTISSTSAGLTIGSPSSQTISITDNDIASLIVVESNGSTAVTEGGATDTYTIALNGQPTSDVTVTLTPDAQVSVNPASLIFTAANYNSPRTVTVTAVDDAVVEGTHSGIVQQTVTGGGTYNGIAVASVTAVITDNDVVATPMLAATPTTLTAFTATMGTASAQQTYTLTGSNLSGPVSVSAPAGFQVSTDGAAFQDQLTVPLTAGAVSTTIAVRLTAVAPGPFSGNITNVSGGLTANVAVTGQVNAATPAPSNSQYYPLATAPFTQDWTNTGLITTTDSWTNVQSIIGYRGDDLTTATGTDPQTILSGAVTPINVIANQTNPNTLNSGGVAEFEITNPTVALNGSGTADAPNIVIYLNTTGVANVNVAYNVRDLDGSVDNATQQVALQYRIGDAGNFINVPGAFVTDATSGPSSATQVTPVSIFLPTEVENQSQVQLRIITANAVGNDEWVGIDNIVISGVTGGVVMPTVTVQATDASASEAATDPGVFTITRTGSTTAALAVNYVVGTGAGQAINGTDYTPMLTGAATIAVGQTTATIAITPVDDALVEGNETVVLSLTTGTGYTVNSPRSATVTIADNDVLAGAVRIHDIQGNGHISTLTGNTITNIPGIVTVLRANGFWMQDPTPDADDNTSEGIFVFTSTAPGRTVGESVLVSGTVQEFRANVQNLSITQIASPTVSIVSSGNALPDPIVISSQAAAGVRRIPTNTISNDFPASGDVELSVFDPAEDGLDFFETLEGMRVQINNPVTTSFRNANGQVFVIADKGAGATGLNARGTLTISGANTTDINSAITNSDFNPERIQIDDVLYGTGNTPNQNVGTLLNTIIGVVNYDFQNVTVLPSVAPMVSNLNVPLTKESTTLLPTASQLTIASFNVENLAGNEPQAKYDGLALGIKNNLGSPDILAIEEIQDNNGATDNGVVDATTTLDRLTTAISAAGGPSYQYRQINPVNDQDGGEPGGNIRVGILFNPARVQFVDRPGGGPTVNTTVSNVGGQPQLSASPGRILDTNPNESDSYAGDDFTATRKPLVGELTFNGQPVYMIVNHFSSRGGSGQLAQRFQPPTQEAQGRREEQGKLVNAFVDQLLAVNPNANVVVLGDFNEFQFLPELQYLKGNLPGETPVLTNLIESLPVQERYTYSFDGNAQALDYVLASNALVGKLDAYDAVHLNSEFLDQLSDHDPSVARFNFGAVATPLALTLTASPTMILTTGTTTLSATVSGGTTPYSYTFTGPGTIAASSNTATVSNLPAGVQTFTVVARDATTPTSQTISATVSVTVTEPMMTPTTLRVLHRDASNGQFNTNAIYPYFILDNTGSTAIPYNELTVRYWLTVENPAPVTNLPVYGADFGAANVQPVFVPLNPARSGATGYVEYSFKPAAGSLGAMTNSGVVSTAISKQDYSTFNQADDYSYAMNRDFTPNLKFTAYRNGVLIWGTEPTLPGTGTTPLTVSVMATAPVFPTTDNSTLVANANGGSGVYSYSFSGPGTITQTANTAVVSNQAAGVQTFTVVVTDTSTPAAQTATATVSVTVTAPVVVTPLALTLTASPTMILTTGTTTLSATVSGGSVPYSYTFTGPGTIVASSNTATVSNLPAGVQTFTVVARDATTPTSQTISATVSVTVTAPVVATSLRVLHRDASNGNLNTNAIYPYFILDNTGSTAIPYSELTVRYYLTVENPAPVTNLPVYGADFGAANVQPVFVPLNPARTGATGYVEYRFTAGAGSLGAMSNSGVVSTAISKQDYSAFNQADDYSFARNGDFTPNTKFTAYRNGTLIWGTEPVSGARLGNETGTGLTLQVLGNPVSDRVSVSVTGAAGEPLTVTLSDVQGRVIGQRSLGSSEAAQTVEFSVSQQAAGMLLLRASTPTQQQSIRVLKAN